MPILILIFMGVFGGIGAAMAGSRGRSGVAWFFICAFTGLFGIIILALIGSSSVPATAQLAAPSSQGPDLKKRWSTLVDLDPDIAAASAKARSYGQECEDILADKYLTLNDKAYLSAALEKAIAGFQSQAQERQVMIRQQGDDSGEIKGPLGISKYARKEDRFVIVSGPFVGNSFTTHDDMVRFFSA
ncbi:hypothetical protein [Rhizobium tropici]|uniref:Uncharacterized protein n=1 Tax=Rhizobium tropici TaxID=398 RepID=A0A329Y742_RHITR|nr:hypothetical protein [Rhizobium tropici]RAX37854.1 hypothetical protein DQ393_29645 [Rhizobium tropici]